LRIQFLGALETAIHDLIQTHMKGRIMVTFAYRPRLAPGNSFEEFLHSRPNLESDEQRMGRSLFGPHLDDIIIEFQDMKTKAYASRGQQKLIVLLMKIA